MKKPCLFAFSVFIFLISCGQKNIELPSKRPEDLMVSYHVDGGMSDYSVQIDVFGDSCHYRKRNDGKVSETRFKLSVSDRDSVYTLLQKNKFDKIKYKTEDGIVHDRGGISMTAGWGKNRIAVSNAQSSFVADGWYEQWKMLTEGIEGMITRRAEGEKELRNRK